MSVALQSYAKYYADPYSQIDEDDIEGETYVCPACGTINPLDATACTHCGRDKARALLLLAKNKIKQSPPVKRKQKIVPPPQADLEVEKTPTLDEFIDKINAPKKSKSHRPRRKRRRKNKRTFQVPIRRISEHILLILIPIRRIRIRTRLRRRHNLIPNKRVHRKANPHSIWGLTANPIKCLPSCNPWRSCLT